MMVSNITNVHPATALSTPKHGSDPLAAVLQFC